MTTCPQCSVSPRRCTRIERRARRQRPLASALAKTGPDFPSVGAVLLARAVSA